MEQSISVEIDAPAERVWSVLRDAERWPEWTSSVTKVTLLDGELRLGARAKISQPRIPTVDYTVTELDEGREFVWVTQAPGARTTARHRVEAISVERSRAFLSVTQQGWLGSIVGRFYRGLTDRYLTMEAGGLKARAESDTPPRHTG
jgi:uncharacterized membrane protein